MPHNHAVAAAGWPAVVHRGRHEHGKQVAGVDDRVIVVSTD
jgi:hypothetical protein